MTNNSYDPAGHIKLSVSSANISKEFYNNLFNQLKWKKVTESNWGAGWVSSAGFGFWIKEAENKTHSYNFSSPGIHHFCFKVSSKEEVDKLYKFLVKKNVKIYDKPLSYPEYTKDYYAVFFADPDGIKLEVAYY